MEGDRNPQFTRWLRQHRSSHSLARFVSIRCCTSADSTQVGRGSPRATVNLSACPAKRLENAEPIFSNWFTSTVTQTLTRPKGGKTLSVAPPKDLLAPVQTRQGRLRLHWRLASPPMNRLPPIPSLPMSRFEIVDFACIPGVPCPCGTARRAFADVPDFPGTVHVTEISREAKSHYHRRLTEVYYFLECQPDARMELDGQIVEVRPGQCILIRPGVRHRAIGEMKVLIIAAPKFDPEDEWFD